METEMKEVTKMHTDDLPHDLRGGKGDVVKVAATQERIGKILLGVARDDDHRAIPGLDGLVDLHDVEAHLVQHVQHVVLEIRVRLVDLIDEQDHPRIGDESLPDLSHLDVLFDVAHIALGIAETAVVQTGEGIVLVQGLHQFHAGLYIQYNEGHIQGFGNGVRQYGLARTRLTLQQQRQLQLHRNVHDLGQLRVEYVLGSTAKTLAFYLPGQMREMVKYIKKIAFFNS